MTCVPFETSRANRIGYVQWHADAARRHRAGERQRRCPSCSRYYWPDEADEHGGQK